MQVTALMNMPTESRQMRVCKTPVRDMMLTSAPQSTMSGAGVLAESKQGKVVGTDASFRQTRISAGIEFQPKEIGAGVT